MKDLIHDALIGMLAALMAIIVVGGTHGYFNGLAMDGPDANYGWDGAFGTAFLMVLVYGGPIAVIGMLIGAFFGQTYRKSQAV